MSDAASGAIEGFARRLEELVREAEVAGVRERLPELLAAAMRRGRSGRDGEALPAERFGMLGRSPAMIAVFDLIERVAPSDVSVLIQGETGTGKELVARAVHDASRRAARPFVAVNCAAVPANLLESELFGHVRGAFTGAVADRAGHFRSADGGTLFLDEIGDMPLEMQAKLLRVLQEGEVRPVGGSKTHRVDVRVVAATHRDLKAMCAEGRFREDLLFRLDVVRLELPPLRDREGDVALLAGALVGKLAAELGVVTPELTPEALERLAAWRWPGNVRELENELRRAIALSGGRIGPEDLSPGLAAGA
jgi:transcriptional regulator with GAF, ATPase, and Fis domain